MKKLGCEGEDEGVFVVGEGCAIQEKRRRATLTCLTVHWNDVIETGVAGLAFLFVIGETEGTVDKLNDGGLSDFPSKSLYFLKQERRKEVIC